MSDANTQDANPPDANPPKEKPKLSWIDIAITVTLVASILGLAAWLLSGRFSYVAAPASSFGLVNLLKKPKSEEDDEADETSAAAKPVTATGGDKPTNIAAPLPLIENPNPPVVPPVAPAPVEPTPVNPAPIDRNPFTDPFDSSLLVPIEPPAIATPPAPTPAPEPHVVATVSATEQPVRYLREQFAGGIKSFQSFDLRNVELNYEELRLLGADLREVRAERASLQQIDLAEANLGRGNLQYAKLDGANLSYTNLAAANLTGASLCGANLRDAKLNDAQLALADLSYADLSGADLSGADLTDTNLFRARLEGTKLPAGVSRS